MTDCDLNAPYHHVAALPSKNLRAYFIQAVNRYFLAPEFVVSAVTSIVEKLHNASLLLDDIEDDTKLRRGQPTAHTIFGVPLTINCANSMMFVALNDLLQLAAAVTAVPTQKNTDERERVAAAHGIIGNSAMERLVNVYTQEMLLLHEGQGQDIFWRDTGRCPTIAEYSTMVKKKTGGLFRMALRLLSVAAFELGTWSPQAIERTDQSTRDMSKVSLSHLIGIIDKLSLMFQILDDYLNLCSEQYHEQKSFCDDLSEGKFSFVVTHSVRVAGERCPKDVRLLHALQQHTQEIHVKKFCLQLMQETDSFNFTRQTLSDLGKEVLEEILKFEEIVFRSAEIVVETCQQQEPFKAIKPLTPNSISSAGGASAAAISIKPNSKNAGKAPLQAEPRLNLFVEKLLLKLGSTTSPAS